MRLTLRTMLCYLDDVLDASDARELGNKIEESEYATNVVHRVRSSMRRLRLGAPTIEGDDFDSNMVADYLDNTLPPEKVADFERACLDVDSEKQLAEVAACHQILTLVLGEPAEVPLSMRHRIYGLAHLDEQQLAVAGLPDHEESNGTAETQHRVDAPQTNDATGAIEPAKSQRQKPEIPEYLRKGSDSQRAWPMALVVLLLVILLGGIAITLWPPGSQRAAGDGDTVATNQNPKASEEDNTKPDEESQPTDADGGEFGADETVDGIGGQADEGADGGES